MNEADLAISVGREDFLRGFVDCCLLFERGAIAIVIPPELVAGRLGRSVDWLAS